MSDVITIVSGLPRSGTSMMMRMLEAGGMKVLVDHIRKPDEDNPKGYYEFERVKKIREDEAWLDAAAGKVVKMVSMLLYDLPSDRKYKVIFMRRNMSEILRSQRTMIGRSGGGDFDEDGMSALFNGHLVEMQEWLAAQKNIEVLSVRYDEVVADPQRQAHRINLIMDGSLNEEEMCKAVDSSLYRNRKVREESTAPESDVIMSGAGEQQRIADQLTALGYM